jgi:hypothetical protein
MENYSSQWRVRKIIVVFAHVHTRESLFESWFVNWEGRGTTRGFNKVLSGYCQEEARQTQKLSIEE